MVFIFFERSFNLCIKQLYLFFLKEVLICVLNNFIKFCIIVRNYLKLCLITLNFVKCFLIIQNLVNDEKIKKYFLNENQIFY